MLRVMRTVIHGFVLFLLIPTASIAEPGPLRLAIMDDLPPSISAVAVEVTTLMFNNIGQPVRIVALPADRALFLLTKGELDGDIARTELVSMEHQELIRTREPLVDIVFSAFGRQPRYVPAGWQDLKSLRVGYRRGTRLPQLMLQQIEPAEQVSAPTLSALLQLIARDRADVIVGVRGLIQEQARKDGNSEISEWTPPLAVVPLYTILRRELRPLIPRLDAEMARLKQAGILEDIMHKHLPNLQLPDIRCVTCAELETR